MTDNLLRKLNEEVGIRLFNDVSENNEVHKKYCQLIKNNEYSKGFFVTLIDLIDNESLNENVEIYFFEPEDYNTYNDSLTYSMPIADKEIEEYLEKKLKIYDPEKEFILVHITKGHIKRNVEGQDRFTSRYNCDVIKIKQNIMSEIKPERHPIYQTQTEIGVTKYTNFMLSDFKDSKDVQVRYFKEVNADLKNRGFLFFKQRLGCYEENVRSDVEVKYIHEEYIDDFIYMMFMNYVGDFSLIRHDLLNSLNNYDNETEFIVYIMTIPFIDNYGKTYSDYFNKIEIIQLH